MLASNQKEITVMFPPEGITFPSILVTHIGGDQYRLDETPLLVEGVKRGDVIELAAQPDGTFIFVSVTEPSPWRMYEYILPKAMIDSQPFQDLLATVTDQGGRWERVFGGCIIMYLPPDALCHPDQAIAAISNTLAL